MRQDPGFGSSLLDQISTNLMDVDMSDVESASLVVVHLYPEDFPTVSAGMKAIVSSFVDKEEHGTIEPFVERNNVNSYSKAKTYIFTCKI